MDQPGDPAGDPSTHDSSGDIGQHINGCRDPVMAKQLIELDACGCEKAQEQSHHEGVQGAGSEATDRQIPDRDKGHDVNPGLNERRGGEDIMRKRNPQDILPMRGPVEFRPREADDEQDRSDPKEEQRSPERSNHEEKRIPSVMKDRLKIE
jgi:hypothetical protein